MGRILVSASHYDTVCINAKEYLENLGHEVVFDPVRPFPSYSYEELKEILPDIDAAIIGMDVFDEATLHCAPRLKAVAKFGVGVDNIDGAAAAKQGIRVINAPGQNSDSVAELTVGLVLCLLRGIIPFNTAVSMGKWPRSLGVELREKTVGLVGFGAIAKCVAQKLSGFGVRILAYDVKPDTDSANAMGVTLCALEVLLAGSDIVSLHAPGIPETKHIISSSSLSAMKKGSYLINTARGTLVDLDAVAKAISSGHLAGAALDAFELEPLPEDAPILRCGNVICTPHIGGETTQAYVNLAMSTAKDIAAVLDGREPRFCTNKLLLKNEGYEV